MCGEFGQFFPLLGRGVDAGGVVAAAVKEHHVAGFGFGQIGDHAVPIQAVGGFVVIAVVADIDADGIENGVVVRPGGNGNPHVLRAGLAFDKFGGHAQGTGAAKALCGFGAACGNHFAAFAEQQFLGFGIVGGHAVDGQVVFALLFGQKAGFGGLNGFEHRRFAGGVFVHADAQIDFLGAGFGFEGFAQAENRVGGGGGDFIEQHNRILAGTNG